MEAKKPTYKLVRNYATKELAEEVARVLTGEWNDCLVKEAEGKFSVVTRTPVKPSTIQLMSIWASGWLQGKYGEYKG